ncbi:MAG: oligosaccharide flippase family protein [Bacteroidota bacterium]|nr:oligosaccharide flippase family protein [Bacteroidota bacterium]
MKVLSLQIFNIKEILLIIKNKFSFNKNKKQVLSNIFSLSLLQFINYLFPLIAFPFLTRVLGKDNFGLVMFSQYFIQYFIIFIDFGMEYTITREISINRYNRKKIIEIFNSVMIIKSIIFIISIIILLLVIFSFNSFTVNWKLHVLTFLMVFGQMIFPVWLFQGIEKMKYITIINVISKLVFTVCLFFFIKKSSDILLVALINSLGYIIGGIISFVIALRIIKYKLFVPSKEVIKKYFNLAKNVFISNFGTSLYMTSTPFILGVVTNRHDVVGFYAIAEKIVRGIRYSITPVTQALFPFLSKKFTQNNSKNSINILFKLSLYLLPILFLMLLMVNIFTHWIANIFTNPVNNSVIIDIRIISIILIIGTLNNVWGILGMVNLRLEKFFRNYVLISGVFNIILCITLAYYFLDIGASISMVLTEILLLILISIKMKSIYLYA